jgi:hypothetical protein
MCDASACQRTAFACKQNGYRTHVAIPFAAIRR